MNSMKRPTFCDRVMYPLIKPLMYTVTACAMWVFWAAWYVTQ